jgi:hypothetical protein
MSVQMLSPQGRMTSSSEQNLDGEPSWNAGGLQAPTVDDDPTSQSDAVVSSKLTFSFTKPDPHEFVMRSKYGPTLRRTLPPDVRIKEMGPDLFFSERFKWNPELTRVSLDFW